MTAPSTRDLIDRHFLAHKDVLAACHDPEEWQWLKRTITYNALSYYRPGLFNMYIYRLDDAGKRFGSYIDSHLEPMIDVEEYLKVTHGPGGYEVLVRRGRDMVHTHKFWIAAF